MKNFVPSQTRSRLPVEKCSVEYLCNVSGIHVQHNLKYADLFDVPLHLPDTDQFFVFTTARLKLMPNHDFANGVVCSCIFVVSICVVGSGICVVESICVTLCSNYICIE